MNSVLVLAISVAIAAVDIKSHRIPNRLTLVLFFALALFPRSSKPEAVVIAILLTVVIGTGFRFGAGDIKLVIALILTSGQIILTREYFLGMALTATLTILLTRLILGSSVKSIPFAPSILLPFIASYLAI
jgi:Flp pilus assembly protein protease CpaA